MNIKTEAVSSKNDIPRIHVKKEEEEDRDNDDHNSSNNYGCTATDTAGRRSCGFGQVKVKKEEEEEEMEDDGNNNNNNNPAEINYCSNNNNKNNNDNNNDDYADWKVGNWCWVLSPSTTTATNTSANANATATAIPSTTSISSSSRSSTSTSLSRKRTAASGSRNTTSLIKKDTPKSKKTRLLHPPPPPPPLNNYRHATTVKRNEEDSVCYNDEVNNKANDDGDDGYESWTEGNWCLILPSGSSSSSSSTHTGANIKYTKKQNNQWNKMFHRLISYKNQHNSTSVIYNYTADPELGKWVNNQRTNYRNNSMSDHRVNLLDSIGFVWNALDNKWDEMFQRLVTYKNQHEGSTSVPRRYGADIQLGRWVRWQQRNYSIKIISVHRIERLESIGFVWNATYSCVLDGRWMEMYDRLVAYKEQHKSTQVPQTYTDEDNEMHLGMWVMNQRNVYNNGKLLKERVELLNSIDFAWKFKR